MNVLYEPFNFAESSDRGTVAFVARRYELDPAMVAAIIMQESGGNPFAIRYEPGYRWLYPKGGEIKPPRGVSYDTEVNQQKTSWGSMQIMGAVAREMGCPYSFLSTLCIPGEGLEWGCRFLASLRRRFGSDPQRYVSAYNAGTPREGSTYVESVLHRYNLLRGYEWK